MANTVLITGASQGTGKATALLFARQGYDVILAARQPERLEQVAEAVRTEGRQALAVPTDMGDVQQVEVLVYKALDQFGRIDVLVNNAGYYISGAMEQTSLDDWQRVMQTNFWGYLYTIRTLLPQFLERGSGTIVNVGGFGNRVVLPEMTAYFASKYAVIGLTNALRLELTPRGIQVSEVHPGVINSDFLERAIIRSQDAAQSEERREQLQAMLQASWVSQPEAIAEAIWEAVQERRSEVIVGEPMAVAKAMIGR